MTRNFSTLALLFAALTACASETTTEEPPLTPASYVQTPRFESDSAEPEDAPTCVSDAECYRGFSCMYDPERSQAVRYCLRR
jgi:hypothetical protein